MEEKVRVTKNDMEPAKLQHTDIKVSEVNKSVKEVHVVYKSHFDIGFTNSAGKMIHDTINWQLPVAIGQCEKLREKGCDKYFAWTLPSWFVWQALRTKSGDELKSLEAALERGDVVWTATPFTPHTEYMDESLFEHSINLSKMLDKRFGKNYTVAAKFTDVPGNSIGMLKILAKMGVKLVQIGVNHMSAMPKTPAEFIWRDAEGNEVIVMYCRGYGNTVRFPGSDIVLAQILKGDNMELADLEEIVKTIQELKAAYPNAEVKATSYGEFAEKILEHKDLLPVYTEEIGDSWIHGTGSDPLKTSRYRVLSRLRRKWLDEGVMSAEDPDMIEYSNNLILVAEHTWGVSHLPHLADMVNWDNEGFEAVRHRGTYKTLEASWQEQRDYIEYAVESLSNPELKREAFDAVLSVEAERPYENLRGAESFNPDEIIEYNGVKLKISKETGAICSLEMDEIQYADENHQLGKLAYKTYDQDDFLKYIDDYCSGNDTFLLTEFGKKGIENTYCESKYHDIVADGFYKKVADDGLHIVVAVKMSEESIVKYGGALEVYNEIFIPAGNIMDNRRIQLKLSWFDKTATRLPESYWYEINPIVNEPNKWMMNKMGYNVSPLNVMENGGSKLHALQDGVVYDVSEGRSGCTCGKMKIKTYDAALVAPGKPGITEFTQEKPDMKGGWHFNLQNNIWNTNFVAWYGGDNTFVFDLEF